MTAHGGDASAVRTRLDSAATKVWAVGFSVGAVGILLTAAMVTAGGEALRERFLNSWLMNWTYFLTLSLGSLFFVLLQHITKAGWSVVVRRLAEGFAANFALLALLSIPIVTSVPDLFEWARPEAVEHDHLLQVKSPYLNVPFFLIRLAVYFAFWIGASEWLRARSLEQDRTGKRALTTRMQDMSYPSMFLFALTTTFAAFDLLMSLEPRWFSTIFGVYFFAGSALGAFSVLPLATYFLQRSGRLRGLVSIEHYHDLGKLMFAFVVFWSYIAFSQYMLIWYANIPEETVWFLRRQSGEWLWFSWFIILGHFLLPFLGIISRIPKRRPGALAWGAVWLLAAHWGDIYWISMPHISEGKIPFHLLDLTCFLGIAGLWVGTFAFRMRKHALVPERDPRLAESLAFHNY